ncbi:MAG: tetratricopeptide repeat protein, partial [Chromatiales bacterium]|nr:tetratricopeptide repeat protein [Chromatiales bacterium]
ELADELNMHKEYADAILKIGNIYTLLGDFSKNSELLFQALGIYEKLNDKEFIAYALSSIAASYYEQNNLDKALEYELKSLPLSQEINDLDGISRSLSNLGVMYGDLKDYEKQKLYYREAIRIGHQIGIDLGLAVTYLNYGEVNSNLDKLDTSFYYYNKALLIFKEFNNVRLIADVHLLSSQNYLKMKKTEQGLTHAQIALQLGIENDLLKTIHRSYKVLHELYSSMGDMDSAYKYSLLQYQIKDSLDLESTLVKLSQTEMKYEFEKVLQENKNKQKLKEYKYIIFSIASISVFILLVSEPDFWDAGGFYNALSIPTSDVSGTVALGTAAGLAVGAAAAGLNHQKKAEAVKNHGTVTIDDLEKTS